MQVCQQPGGVGRNIAEALTLLAPPRAIRFISIVGSDPAGSALHFHWAATGSHTGGILQEQTVHTPTVCAVLDQHGELQACVADTGAVESDAMRRWVQTQLAAQRGARGVEVVVLDANVEEGVLAEASRWCRERALCVVAEPVSVAKCTRCVCASIRVIKANNVSCYNLAQ
jgi:sugar/nucleoside kinase (ribokinase family)